MIVLDGATGTELGRRGVDTRTQLFSAAALLDERGMETLRGVHLDHARAGAQVVTANTFRTNPRKAGARFEEMTRAAVRAACATGLPVWVSAMAMPDGRMRSGDDLRAFFRAAAEAGARAALINCVPCLGVDLGLDSAAASGLPFGGYAHMGEVDAAAGWPTTPVLTPADYARRAARWLERGALIAGGCCGTTPEHVAALAALTHERHDPLHLPPRRPSP